ncbi:hypothetical protein FHG87_009809 [Trinorchestia longiramus]|nr:hypothetical protein FHG87_009809 [Trinorchestia longiramus]
MQYLCVLEEFEKKDEKMSCWSYARVKGTDSRQSQTRARGELDRSDFKLEEICVGNELESEDILVMRCEKVQTNESIIVVLCYMTTMRPLAQEDNVKKYTVLERVVQEFSRFQVIVMGLRVALEELL